MKFKVLTPDYIPAGRDFKGNMQYNVQWTTLGTASSMEDAKRKFGGNPVLEAA